MRKMSLIIYILLIFDNIYSLNISNAVSHASQNNPKLIELSNDIIMQKIKINNLNLAQYPDITLGVNYSGANNSLGISANINYPLIDWGVDRMNIEKEKIEYELSLLNYNIKKKEIEFNTKALFYEVLMAEMLVEIREQYLQQAVLELNQAEGRFREGLIDNLTYQTARRFFLLSQYNLLSSKNYLEEKMNSLKAYINYYDFTDIEGDFIKVPESFQPGNNLKIAQLEKQKEYEHIQFNITTATYKWNVDLYSGYYYSQSFGAQQSSSHNIQAGFNIYIPALDWLSVNLTPSYSGDVSADNNFSVSGTVNFLDENNSFYYRKSALLSYETRVIEIDSQLERLKAEEYLIDNKILELEVGISVASNLIEVNELNLKKVEILYQTGGKTVKELLDARLAVIDSQVEYLKAIFNYNKYIWKLRSIRMQVI